MDNNSLLQILEKWKVEDAHLLQILRIENLEDAMNFLTDKDDRICELLIIQCINLQLPITEDIISSLHDGDYRGCIRHCLKVDDCESLLKFASRGGWENVVREIFASMKMITWDMSNILGHLLENNSTHLSLSDELEVSDPNTIAVLEKFNISYSGKGDDVTIKRRELPSRLSSYVDSNIPHVIIGSRYVIKIRTLVDIMLASDIDDLDLLFLDLMRYLEYGSYLSTFLNNEEYKNIFNKLLKFRLALELVDLRVNVQDPFVLRVKEYAGDNFIGYLRFGGFLKGFCYLTESQQDFLIMEHPNWLRYNLKQVIRSGKIKLINATRKFCD